VDEKLPFTGERLTPEVSDPLILIEHLHRYAFAQSYCKDKEVLDIASGEGYGTYLLSKVARNITGVDIDGAAVAYAKKKYTAANLAYIAGSAEKIPVADHSMDVVVSFETLEHLDKQEEMMQEIKRVMRPDGVLIISTPEKKNYSDETGHKNQFHKKELYQHEFESLLKKYFKQVQLMAQQSGILSVLYPAMPAGLSPMWLSKGNTRAIEIVQGSAPLYLVALASERDINDQSLSFFKSNSMVDVITKKQANQVVASRTYRAGKIIAAPFSWLKSIFNKR
jgi:SAM-dependent methyltransferase